VPAGDVLDAVVVSSGDPVVALACESPFTNPVIMKPKLGTALPAAIAALFAVTFNKAGLTVKLCTTGAAAG
jgi:hypothetical protein